MMSYFVEWMMALETYAAPWATAAAVERSA